MAVELVPLPPRDAIAAVERRGRQLDPSFSWLDAWQEDHARMFTVAKSAGFDILTEVFEGLLKALSEGKTFRDFAAELTPLLQAKGWWARKLVTDPATGEQRPAQLGSVRRLQTIFDTNMRVSYAAGHWASFERNKVARPFLRYVAILDERTRPAHRARHNLVLPVDHPYWSTWAPPCGWGCRCTLQSLSQRDIEWLQREGEQLVFEPPDDTFRNFVNRRTGEITRVPDGIDPGWGYNPGREGYLMSAYQTWSSRVASAPPELAEAAIREAVASDAFGQFVREPLGTMPVMVLPPEIRAASSGKTTVALLSEDTMRKQLSHHPELTADDYRLLPDIASSATMIVQDGANTYVLIRLDADRWRHVALKATQSGKAAFVTSYRFTSEANIRRLINRAGVKVIVDRGQVRGGASQ